MKRLALLIVAVMVLANGVAWADEVSEARWNLAKKGTGFVAGFLAGAVGHYHVGHRATLALTNTDHEWHSFNSFSYHQEDDRKRALVAGSGFLAQILGSEIVLGFDKIPKDNSFVLGYMGWNILNPILYTLTRECRVGNFGSGYGDLEVLDRSGIKAEYVEISLIAHALWSAYRLYNDPKFIPYVRATKGEVIIGIGWKF